VPHPCFPKLSATGCGIASILSKLCFVDEDVNSGKGYDILGQQYFSTNMWVKEAFNLPRNKDVFELAKRCAKIFYLQNNADPAAGANAYFSAALTALYSIVIITDMPGSKMDTYGIGLMQQEYNKNIDDLTKPASDTCFIEAYGEYWFFCKLA